MTRYDLSPLFRSSVGFDRFGRMFDAAQQIERTTSAYPPYNIVKTDETNYSITLAVAGFAENELRIEANEGRLTITGEKSTTDEDVEYLHRGIAGRTFERSFQLADHIVVQGARLENGLLHVALERVVPEALKPRTIAITGPEVAMAAK
jgi:molecular chaperone IbpA